MTHSGESEPRRRRTGLGWPRRLHPSRLLGWPRVSRETTEPASTERDTGSHAEAQANKPDPAARPASPEVARETDHADGEDWAVPPEGHQNHHPRRAAAPPEPGTPTPAQTSQTRPPTDDATDGAQRRRNGQDGAAAGEDNLTAATEADRAKAPNPADLDRPTETVAGESMPADAEAPPADQVNVSHETEHAGDGIQMPQPDVARTLVVANQKGGVGKTTTVVNLAAALARGGLSVLVVDLDPQANASTALGIDHPRGRPGTYEILINGDAIADHVAESAEAPGLTVLPSTVDLAGAEIELVSIVARENRLKRALKAYLDAHPTDYVLLDCPPSLGLLTVNALVAANEVLIPIQCEYYALEGVSQLVETIDLVSGELNSDLRVDTVLLTMYDARTRLAAQVAEEVRAHFTDQTLRTVIPRSVRISEAPSYGQTVFTYHPESAGAVSYFDAAREIARRGAKEN